MSKTNNNTGTTEKKIKNRIIYCVCFIVCGIISLVLGLGNVLPVEMSENIGSFYIGVGCGLIAASVITIIRNIRTLRNAEKLKEKEIYDNDERNQMIVSKSWSYAGWAMFVILYMGMLVAGFIGEMVLTTLLVIMGIYALCLFFARMYCEKTM